MFGAPLVIGLTRQVRARWESRAGGSALRPWRDLRKQLGKQRITPPGTTVVFATARRLSPTGPTVGPPWTKGVMDHTAILTAGQATIGPVNLLIFAIDSSLFVAGSGRCG
jgi:hypothetical protein